MATIGEESDNGLTGDQTDTRSETEARVRQEVKLRQLLRIHRYAPIKWKHGKYHIHFWYFLVMILQFVKIVLITVQMFKFADDRGLLTSAVKRGHLTLRHLLLKSWDSEMETPHYPPAHGDFAMYDVKDLLEEMNYAVEAYFNIENDAIGFYKLYNNGNHSDGMIIRLKYFDFPGFDGHKIDSGLTIKDGEIEIRNGIGITSTVDPKTNKTTYKYNITEAFEVMNLTEPVKRLLSLDLDFSFHSVMAYKKLKSALCFYVKGTVSFSDEDNSGQMLVDLVTSYAMQSCSDISISVPDVDLDTGYTQLGIAVALLCSISLATSIYSIIFGFVLFVMTRRFMKNYYKCFYGDDNGTNLSNQELVKCFSFVIWDIFMLLSDVSTIFGTSRVVALWTCDAIVPQLDVTAIALSSGGFFSCIYILKIFKIHHTFNILFKIMSAVLFPIIPYIICAGVLYIGFFLCGRVVLGPHHVKFESDSATSETLFSIICGDEIFATLANAAGTKEGGHQPIWVFSSIYVCAYSALFTMVVINIFMAFFVGAQDTLKDRRQKNKEILKIGSLEKALYNLLAKIDYKQRSTLRSSLINAIEGGGNASPEILTMKAEIERLWNITSKPVEPRLKAFMEGKYPDSSNGCCYKSLVFYVTPGHFLCKRNE